VCTYIVLRWVINALVLMLIPYIVNGVTVDSFYIALIVAIVLALVNSFLRPILMVLTLPINVLTLGLFTLVINGFCFWFISTFIRGFNVTDFNAAFWAALVYAIIAIAINSITGSAEEVSARPKKIRARKRK